MEPDSPHILHTVVLTRLTDEASREGVAEALSRLGGLPVERVLRRLETLPWTLIKDASRAKTLRLVTLLEQYKVETVVVPPLIESEAPLRSGTTQETDVPAPTERPTVPQWPRTAGSPGRPSEEPRALPRAPTVAMEPLPLEGVLDPAFHIGRPDSWLLALASVPWHILSGTLRALAGALDRSFDVCRMRFWNLFAIIAIPWIIVAGIGLVAIVPVLLLGLTVDTLWGLPLWTLVVGTVVLIPVAIVAGMILLFLPQAALIHAISETYLGRDTPLVEVYRFAWTKLIRFVLTHYLMMFAAMGLVIASAVAAGLVSIPLILGLAWADAFHSALWIFVVAMVSSMVFVLPLAYCLPKLLLFDKVVIIEDCAYADALKRSWNLLSGRAGTAWYTSYYWLFGMLLLVLIPMQLAVWFLFEGPALLVTHLLPVPKIVGTYTGQVLSTFGSLLGNLYVSVVMVLFYYCIRSRREGHDLLALAQTDLESSPD